jgi:hypothetical protein
MFIDGTFVRILLLLPDGLDDFIAAAMFGSDCKL